MVLIAAALALLTIGLEPDLFGPVVSAALIVFALFAAWYALTRAGWRRSVGAAVCAVAVIGIVTLIAERTNVILGVVGIALLAPAVALARWALGRDLRTLKAEPKVGMPVAPALRPVLLTNPRSGGGKAERFRLVEACIEQGIEPVVLAPRRRPRPSTKRSDESPRRRPDPDSGWAAPP
jgi:hypothetical protein